MFYFYVCNFRATVDLVEETAVIENDTAVEER